MLKEKEMKNKKEKEVLALMNDDNNDDKNED